jgi:hypothetical protein
MRIAKGLGNALFGRAALATAALGGLLFVAGAPAAKAADRDNCERRIAKADYKLHEAIEHHGYRSEQAEHARHELYEERERCWNTYHRWWDEDEHRWHTERDWRDDDHEHYRDRDNH